MKKFIILLGILITVSISNYAQNKVVQIYDGAIPGTENWNWEEGIQEGSSWKTQVVYNVAKPSLTIFAPDASIANGTAVVICPGGGFIALLMGNEGYDVAKPLVKKGITCFVLKYRLAHINTTDAVKYFNDAIHGRDQEKLQNQKNAVPFSIADGKAAIKYVRAHAGEYKINPDKIGIVGFSAGGTVAASAAFNYTAENKPNFVTPIYAYFPKEMQGKVNNDAPPLFIVVAANDALNLQQQSIDLFTTWNTAKKDAELHVYNEGSHGFGMRVQHTTSDTWIERLTDWMAVKELIKK